MMIFSPIKILLIITSVIVEIFIKGQVCPQYQCVSNTRYCFNKVNPMYYLLSECDFGYSCSLNFSSSSCSTISYTKYLQFNGNACNNNTDCISGMCNDKKKCSNKNASNPDCTSNNQCDIGTFCQLTTKTCIPLRKTNENCENDQDCQYDLGCYNKNKTCINYFSLSDGSQEASKFYLCQSGNILNGTCSSAKLISNSDCSSTGYCIYNSGTDNSTALNSTTSCNCGYNSIGAKYCDLDTNSPELQTTISVYKELIYQNQTLCHTAERFQLCVSNAYDAKSSQGNYTTNNRFEYDKKMRMINNELTRNSNYFRYVQNEEYCGYSILGKYSKYLIKPDSTDSCPVYTCDKSAKSCVSAFNPNKIDSSGIQVKLNPGLCKENEYCKYDIKNTYTLENYSGICQEKSSNPKRRTFYRYPGEICTYDSDCLNKLCMNGRCFAKKLGDNCKEETSTSGCGLGMYCGTRNSTSKELICQNLKEIGQECSNSFECKMNLICYSNVCSKEYFSFKNDDKIFTDKIMDSVIKNDPSFLCESAYFSSDTSTCVNFKIMNKTDENGYSQCNLGEKNSCVYMIQSEYSNSTFTKECSCGLNTFGKAFCPIDNSNFANKYKTLRDKIKSFITLENCNSYNRYNCDVDYDKKDEIQRIKKEIDDAHILYQSPSCASDLFSFTIRYSLFAFLISLTILLF